jgi:Ecdysteroid kinase-like family
MMQDKVITHIEEVTAEWLTSVLLISGALSNGAVETFDLDRSQGNWSTSRSLKVRYSSGSRGALPQRLFLKMVNTDLDDEFFGPSEVAYYTNDYVDVENVPLIRCYNAAYSEEKHRYHILLDDLSETHVEAATKAPTLEYGLALAEGLAALHARWWGMQRLEEAGAPIHSAKHIQRFVDIAKPGAGHIIKNFSAELELQWPEAIQTLFARHPPAIIERTQDANGFTLIHGDVGHTNILVPRKGDRPIYFIDRQPFNWSLTTWLGAYDLAYAIVLDWEVETRRRLEIPILRHYHEWLIKNGVAGYPWDQLYEDYRLSVPMGVYIATEYCRGGVNERRIPVWLPMLQRSLTACDDLDCKELW